MQDVLGIFVTKEHLDTGVERLLEAEVKNGDISFLLVDVPSESDLAHEGNSTAVVTSGIALGGALGLVAGAAALAIPGLGLLYAAGPFFGALAGMGAGGALGGWLSVVRGARVPYAVSDEYEQSLSAGHSVLSVHCETQADYERALAVLQAAGARGITTAGDSL